MKALRIFALLITLFISLNSFASKHYIFMIHGINSGNDCFNKMDEALSDVLNRRDHKTEYLPSYFKYETGNDNLSTFDFAESFNDHLRLHFDKHGFNPLEDKISLVMHSQGGLVGTLWLRQSINNEYGTYFHDNVDSFITLGTPFWGTSITRFPLSLPHTIGKLFGQRESKDMLYGSETIQLLKEEFTNRSSEFMYYLTNKVNVVNVIGNAYNYLNLATFSLIEDDIAVPVPSGHMGFYMTNDLESGIYSPDDVIKVDTKYTVGKYYMANALHVNYLEGKLLAIDGLAFIPTSCIKNEYCIHPTYQYIWRTILGAPTHQLNQKIFNKTKSFSIDFNISSKSNINTEDIKFKFYRLDGKRIKPWRMRIKKVYSRSTQDHIVGAGKKHHYVIGGKIYKSNNKDRIEKIMVEVGHKRGLLIPKRFEVTVRPHYTTTINTNLNSLLNSVVQL